MSRADDSDHGYGGDRHGYGYDFRNDRERAAEDDRGDDREQSFTDRGYGSDHDLDFFDRERLSDRDRDGRWLDDRDRWDRGRWRR